MKLQTQNSKIQRAMVVCLTILCMTTWAFAQPQQSANFRITKSVLDAGGTASTSQNFRLVSAFGQPSPIGPQSSANFVLYGGFLSPTFAVAPPSPIEALVIRQAQPNVNLYWPPVTSALSYLIYRTTDPLCRPDSMVHVGTTSDTAYVDAGVVNLPPVKYYYYVTSSREAVHYAAGMKRNPLTETMDKKQQGQDSRK
jgi:hypothetical protein